MTDEKKGTWKKELENCLEDLKDSFPELSGESAEEESFRLQASAIKSLSGDFETVFRIDLDTNKYRIYKFGSVTTADQWQRQQEEKNDFFVTCREYVYRGVYADDQARVIDGLDKFLILAELVEKGSYHINYRAVIGGELKYYQAKFAFMLDDFGHRTGLIMGLHDVDTKTRHEMALIEKLNSALRSAESATAAKSKFLYNMSHDIRTPMNAIVGFTEMAQKNINDKKKIAECLCKIKKSSNYLLTLINDILDVARIENGRIVIEEKPCNLRTCCEEVMAIAQKEAAENDISFAVNLDEVNNFAVYADVLRLNRILLGIIGNAIKYTRPGGRVELIVKQHSGIIDGQADYVFVIKDNGIGMSPDFVNHIFEMFTRDGTAEVCGIEGSGLGMTITKSLIDLMGGTIDIESELGKGTSVGVQLRFRLQTDAEITEQADENDDTSDVILRGKRMLLVDDNELNREIARELLREEGMLVDEAENGAEAVEKVKAHAAGYYSFVLMDIQMPVMNGYEATKAIRNLPDKELARTVIIAMTANAFDEDSSKALAAGMNAHLTKPISVPDFMRTIKKFA